MEIGVKRRSSPVQPFSQQGLLGRVGGEAQCTLSGKASGVDAEQDGHAAPGPFACVAGPRRGVRCMSPHPNEQPGKRRTRA
ncbi:hypothetical protein GCM10028833_12990 [Glycomyces tarimensis]